MPGKNIRKIVSIPSWCDWESISCLTRICQMPFQFHHGAIGSGGAEFYIPANIMFQFHHGAIGRLSKKINIFIIKLFQFHHGAIGS